jgi:hypothetical protein
VLGLVPVAGCGMGAGAVADGVGLAGLSHECPVGGSPSFGEC